MMLSFRNVVMLLALGAGAALTLQTLFTSDALRPDAALAQTATPAAADTDRETGPAATALHPHERHTVNLFEAASHSVVNINTLVRRRDAYSRRTVDVPAGSGSGFVWDAEGHVVTNFHVIRQASGATVTFNDQTQLPATLVGVSPDHDLAVLKVERPDAAPLTPLPRGRSGALKVGQSVYAIGNPFGLDHTLTTGVVSALDREIQSLTGRTLDGVVQSDAAINPGNSGGPLLDSGGRVVGVNTMIFSPSGASAGVGFSIPIDTVQRVVPQLIKNRRYVRPTLGIRIDDRMSGAILKRLDRTGVLVLGVEPDSPAKRAGLKPTFRDSLGDLILGDLILSVEGELVESTDDLLNALERTSTGARIVLRVVRDDEEIDVKVDMR